MLTMMSVATTVRGGSFRIDSSGSIAYPPVRSSTTLPTALASAT